MIQKIRIFAEVYTHGKIPELIEDLPEGWGEWPEIQKDSYLNDAAMDHLTQYAGCGAEVFEIEDDACMDKDGEIWPEHDFPPGLTECTRCGAEADDEGEEL